MNLDTRAALRWLLAALALAAAPAAWAHGDVTPQLVDTSTLPQLGDKWRDDNPYRGNAEAAKIGASGYNQNCARCHGLEAVSGGIAPDLRKLEADCSSLRVEAKKLACVKEANQHFATTVRRGKTQNGVYKMPPFEGILTQEAVWAIKAYLETRHEQ